MGWVHLLLVMLVQAHWLGRADPQLWQPDLWQPERRAKSIAFLGKDEQSGQEEGEQEEEDEEDEGELQEGSESKKAILNVSDKDSPYALIDKYFPERESYFYQNRNKFLAEFSEDDQDIGNLHPNEVWLADDSLLVLKGGSTSDWESFDNPWQPIDDLEAPYREPVLPPPDFDPDTLDIGVGVPIEAILEQREREKKIRAKKKQMFGAAAAAANVREKETAQTSVKEEVEHEVYSKVTNNINDLQAVLAPENKLKPFKEEVERSQDEFRQFLDDVSKFISDMENFHSVKQSASQSLPRSVPTPTPTPPTSPSPSPSTAFTSQTPRSISWRSNISDPAPPSPFPVSYVSPYAKVYLSTKYIGKVSTTTTSPLRPQARSTRQPARQTASTASPPRVLSLSAQYRERSSTTARTTTTTRTTTRTTTSSLPPIFQNYHEDIQEDWQPVTTLKPVTRNFNRQEEFKGPTGPAGSYKYTTPSYSRPPAPRSYEYTTPRYSQSPAPTPYSLFQSVPENIQEHDVFHLSQNVDFGKKLGKPSGGYNEVDTVLSSGPGGQPVSVHKAGRYSVAVTTNPPRLRRPQARGPAVPAVPVVGGGVSLDNLLPAIFTSQRSRNTLRRRRPKYVQPASDRHGNGDVRYVSFFSGGNGGNSWGYSYNLG